MEVRDEKGPEGLVRPSKDSSRHLEVRALVVYLGWTFSPSEPDFPLWKGREVLSTDRESFEVYFMC